MVLGMLQVGGGHVQEVERNMHVAFGHVLKAAPFHQTDRRVDNRFGGEPMHGTVCQAKNVANRMERPDLTATAG